MKTFYAYHVVTERPMVPGQRISFGKNHLNGVGKRVQERLGIVTHIYAHPHLYDAAGLEHHTAVALRELALEEVRAAKYPNYPSRMACLYVSASLEEAKRWFDYFSALGRPTFQIVKLRISGRCFVGDANNCFRGQLSKEENLALAAHYWKNLPNAAGEQVVPEMLVDGEMEVVEVIQTVSDEQKQEMHHV